MTDNRPASLAKHFIAQARAELARVQQNTCGHGVDRNKGRCSECATETSQTNTEETA